MVPRRVLVAIATLAVLAATAAVAQDTEFSRASGGEFLATMKRPNMLSGSLSVALTRSTWPFSTTGNGKTFEGSAGGTLMKDRMWFFASGQLNRDNVQLASAPVIVPTMALGNMTAAINERQTMNSSFSRNAFGTLPSSFLSLHYTGVITPSMSFNASVYQRH